MPALPRGLYEVLITAGLEARLREPSERTEVNQGDLREAEAADRIAIHLAKVVERAVASFAPEERVAKGIDLARRLIAEIEAAANGSAASDDPVSPGAVLRAVVTRLPDGTPESIAEPLIPLLDTTLLTNAPGEPRVGHQLQTEIHSADRIDIVMAFIRRSGIAPLLAALRAHTEAGRTLRVLTTTYTGSTEAKALDQLQALGANVRISYDLSTTRLHAKAWLFHRRSGFSTAYIGSSNLTHSAQITGLEWNVRASGARNAAVTEKVAAVFESYWNSGDFVPYDRDEFLKQTQVSSGPSILISPIELRPEPFQERLLEQIALARELGHHRNLLVSATGTGKTVMAGDFSIYWFRRAHDRLAVGQRAGLVATSAIRFGNNRKVALDYITTNDGIITNAVSERDWPGEATVHVSMVNWHKGPCPGPHRLLVNDEVFDLAFIPPHLQLHADVGDAKNLLANRDGTSQGVTFGTQAFYIDAATATQLRSDAMSAQFIQAVANGDDVLGGKLARMPDYAIHTGSCKTESDARAAGAAYEYLRKHVRPIVEGKAEKATTDHYKTWFRTWWRPFWHRREFLDEVQSRKRLIACSRIASRPIFFFLSTRVVPVEQLQLFAYDDDYSFGILQSRLHWQWAIVKGGRLEERIRYASEVWRTFPWPQEPSENEVIAVAEAARELRRVRDKLMGENGWSLRALYQAAEVAGPHPLKVAQAALDDVVCQAYGMPADQDVTEFLLKLNELVAEDEVEGRSVQGPGVPRGLDPCDPRWTSNDCIEPPGS